MTDVPIRHVVITGSTRGIGYGMADALLARGQRVTICGRKNENVQDAAQELLQKYPQGEVFGCAADVTDYEQLADLWNQAHAHFGVVDIWINNAGLGNPQLDFYQHPPERIATLVQTNLLGTMYGSKVAIEGMLKQGHGFIYNMEGLGSNGRRVDGLTLYGTTKYGMRYLNGGLIKEMKDTPVKVGSISPGMVVTDLLVGQYQERPAEEWTSVKRVFNILADKTETVTPWLVDKILANEKHGAHINWLTGFKAALRFMKAPFVKRDLFGE